MQRVRSGPLRELQAPLKDREGDRSRDATSSNIATRHKERIKLLEQKLQKHMEYEDKRVKELTEAILYDFLPAALHALLPPCEDPLAELDTRRCHLVAAAALCISSLMNAPPGFLEFLLCIPWKKLSQLYSRDESTDQLLLELHVSPVERRQLVNMKLDRLLLPVVLDFLYHPAHIDSVPPMLQLYAAQAEVGLSSSSTDRQGGQERGLACSTCTNCGHTIETHATLETVAAVLDGVTPLHCAAIRGNPAQVKHLLDSGAIACARSAAGELPIELVPVCGERRPGSLLRQCHCLVASQQEVWECRSQVARGQIASRCVFSLAPTVYQWFYVALFCIMTLLGFWGNHRSIVRPAVLAHIQTRREQQRICARRQASEVIQRVRAETEAGHKHLVAARERFRGADTVVSPLEGIEMTSLTPHKVVSRQPLVLSVNVGHQDRDLDPVSSSPSEQAFRCYVQAVHALRVLDLDSQRVPWCIRKIKDSVLLADSSLHVFEDEQAEVYSAWAESVVLKFFECRCGGCAALATQALRMAHIQGTRLFLSMDRLKDEEVERWQRVGQALVRIVQSHVSLSLETDARLSPSRLSVSRVKQCLKDWDHLEEQELHTELEARDLEQVGELRAWAARASSDLVLAEAMYGSSLAPTQTLQEVVMQCILLENDGSPYLVRVPSEELVLELDRALQEAPSPSYEMKTLTAIMRDRCRGEQEARVVLKSLTLNKGIPTTQESLDALLKALQVANQFARLKAEVEEAKQLYSEGLKRRHMLQKLECIMGEAKEKVAQVITDALADVSTLEGGADTKAGKGSAENQAADVVRGCSPGGPLKGLEVAIEEALASNVNVSKAKRLLKEFQAQLAAVGVLCHLTNMLRKRPCGYANLKSSVSKAESAAASLSSLAGVCPLLDELVISMQLARKRLEVEKSSEALYKATMNHRSLSDLPKLEAAVLNAKKVGAEDLDPENYRAASELRAKLAEALKLRQAIEASQRALQRNNEVADAEALERLLGEAEGCGDLLLADVQQCRSTLEQWRLQMASQTKLLQVLEGECTSAELARVIQEAYVAGVKVHNAKRMLKLMQTLESAVKTTIQNAGQYGQLKVKVKAAEEGGVRGMVLEDARRLLQTWEVAQAKELLEGTLQPQQQSTSSRIAILRDALQQVEELLGPDFLNRSRSSSRSSEVELVSCGPASRPDDKDSRVPSGDTGDIETLAQDTVVAGVEEVEVESGSVLTDEVPVGDQEAQQDITEGGICDSSLRVNTEDEVEAVEIPGLEEVQVLLEKVRELLVKEELEEARLDAERRQKATMKKEKRDKERLEKAQAIAKKRDKKGKPESLPPAGSKSADRKALALGEAPTNQDSSQPVKAGAPRGSRQGTTRPKEQVPVQGSVSPAVGDTTGCHLEEGPCPSMLPDGTKEDETGVEVEMPVVADSVSSMVSSTPSVDQVSAEVPVLQGQAALHAVLDSPKWSSPLDKDTDACRPPPGLAKRVNLPISRRHIESSPRSLGLEPRHYRTDSLTVLGEATSKLSKEVLDVLDLADTTSGKYEQVSKPEGWLLDYGLMARDMKLQQDPSLVEQDTLTSKRMDVHEGGDSGQVAGGVGGAPTSCPRESNLWTTPNSSTPGGPASKFSYVDLGGASWGVDNTTCSFSSLQPSLAPSLDPKHKETAALWGAAATSFGMPAPSDTGTTSSSLDVTVSPGRGQVPVEEVQQLERWEIEQQLLALMGNQVRDGNPVQGGTAMPPANLWSAPQGVSWNPVPSQGGLPQYAVNHSQQLSLPVPMGQPAMLEGPSLVSEQQRWQAFSTNKGLGYAQVGPSNYVQGRIPSTSGLYVGYGGQGLGDLSRLGVQGTLNSRNGGGGLWVVPSTTRYVQQASVGRMAPQPTLQVLSVGHHGECLTPVGFGLPGSLATTQGPGYPERTGVAGYGGSPQINMH